MIEAILKAVQIALAVPAAAEAISKIGINIQNLMIAAKEEQPSRRRPTPLERIIEGESGKLNDVIDEYYSIDNDPQYDEVEKNKYRKRVAARACALLKAAAPIKNKIPDYDKLIELFCSTFQTLFGGPKSA